jgi:nicastrin
VVLSGDLLSEDTVKKLEKISRVKGVVVIGEVPPLEAYSETGHFPEANSTTAGEPSSFEWNIHGHDILHHTYKWPMWSVDDLTSGRIITRARSNAVSGTRHGVLLKQFMFGYKNSATCLHFKFCEPVGGHSVWGLLPAPSSQSKPMAEQKFVMSLSRLDAISVFSLDAIGADSDMSGLIANLAALTTLAGNNNIGGVNPEGYQAVDPSKFKFPILWAFFEAEHWAYAGSTRFLNDWTNLQCLNWQDSTCLAPHYQKTDFTQLRLENIKAIIEARQVGVQQHSDHSNKLFVHQHTHSFNKPLVNDVLGAGHGLHTQVETASVNTPGLPPSSAFTFLNAAENAKLTSLKDDIVVIADHSEHYNNRYYGSRYDLRSQLNLTLLTDASTLLARTLYAKAMDVPSSQASFIHVNSTIVSTFLDCLTVNAHCPLFASFVPSVVGTSTFAKPSHYHGPFFDGAYSLVGKVAHDYMIYASRNKSLDSSLVACDDSHSCSNVNARCVLGKCMDSSYVQFHDSYSTGIARNPKGGWTITNPDLENWTEP